jgi:hypothetical protein
MVASTPVECAIEDADLVGLTANIEQNGAWTHT